MAPRNRLLLAACAAVPLILLAACGSSGIAAGRPAAVAAPASPHGRIPSAPVPGSLSETGSTLLFPLLQAWAAAYHRQYPGVSISTAGTGSGAGIEGATAGTVDIGASDAFLSSGVLVQHPRLLNIPLAVSAQQVNYHVPGLSATVHLKLSGEVLARMYEGSIRTWNDPSIAALNPGVRLPAVPVVPLHRSDSSGDTFLFTSYLARNDPAWRSRIGYGTTVAWPAVPRAQARDGNSGMVAGCAAMAGCVAYVGISYLSGALSDGLGEAELANATGRYLLPTPVTIGAAVASFVSATPVNETISMVDGPAAGGYPIVNYEYAIVSARQPDAAKAHNVKAFLHWAITAGSAARYLSQVRFAPLAASVVSLSDAQIAQIGYARP